MRKTKEFEYFSCRMAKDVTEKLAEIVKETDLSKTSVVERAIKFYYQQYKETGKV